MSSEQYQRTVNNLDKEIAALEKKKAASDKKSVDEQKKATNITISKNASASMIKSKMKQIEQYQAASNKAAGESADLAKKIADKRARRNDAYIKLQKAQTEEQKKQDREMKKIQTSYENRIKELSRRVIPEKQDLEPKSNVFAEEEEFDVFVSHACEDKESFVDEFVAELIKLGVKVWYDKSQIKWGDSMRERIDLGLKKSKFGIAVLSPNYIAEGKYWTKAELDGLFQLDSVNGKTLLPIWHQLTKKEVMEYSPIIASKLAMSTALMTPGEIAKELRQLLDNNAQNNNDI